MASITPKVTIPIDDGTVLLVGEILRQERGEHLISADVAIAAIKAAVLSLRTLDRAFAAEGDEYNDAVAAWAAGGPDAEEGHDNDD